MILPTLLDDAVIYLSTNVYNSVEPTQAPPAGSAKRCGINEQLQCKRDADNQKALKCRPFDCSAFCGGVNSRSPQCTACLNSYQRCLDAIDAAYADCGVCTSGTACQDDIGRGYSMHTGYSYCCRPEQSPCDGSCMSTSCGSGTFDRASCKCVCPPDAECYGPRGNFLGCCYPDEGCTRKGCCKLSHICGGICCDRPCCKEVLATVGGTVTATRDVCCSEKAHCSEVGTRGGHCCPGEQEWCEGTALSGCCDPGKCCGPPEDPCCADDEHCSGQHCCKSGFDWAASGWVGAGVAEWMKGECCPKTGKPQAWCGNPTDAARGFQCCDKDRCSLGHCCPISGQVWCGDKCCSPAACCAGLQCADLQNDPAHCGNCFVACNTFGGQKCKNGQCVCPDGRPACGGICCPTGQVCADDVCVAPCNDTQAAGNDFPFFRRIGMGRRKSGTFRFTFNTYIKADRIIVWYERKVLYDSCCFASGGDWTVDLSFSGADTYIEVQVIPNCSDPTPGTIWDFTVGCPTDWTPSRVVSPCPLDPPANLLYPKDGGSS